jgi:hypothetical protein
MTNWIRNLVVIVILAILISWGLPVIVSEGLGTVSAYIYDVFGLVTPGHPNRPAEVNWRGQRRAGVAAIARTIDGVPSDADAFYNSNYPKAESIRKWEVAEQKLQSIEKGTRVPRGPVLQINAQTGSWVPTHTKVFEGDIVCVEGSASHELMIDQDNQRPIIGPEGITAGPFRESIDGHKRYDARFPMMALMGRVNGSNNQVFHLKGCTASPYSGSLEVRRNNPYWNPNGLAAASFSNYVDGVDTITRIERKTSTPPPPQGKPAATPTPNPRVQANPKEAPKQSTFSARQAPVESY